MFRVYANNELIYDTSIHWGTDWILGSKLTLDYGKAGSYNFSIPLNHTRIGLFKKLTTRIRIEYGDREIFRGRIISSTERKFQGMKEFYCEGDLSYLVDSVQRPRAYHGTIHALFREMIESHNAQVEENKRFALGRITVEDHEVIIRGLSEENQNEEDFSYEQIAIDATSSEWPNTFDAINDRIIANCGGYLYTHNENGVVYIDLLAAESDTCDQAIEFGVNMLDMSEEKNVEELFTVLIPVGEENLTIESVNHGSTEIIDEEGVAEYGRIIRSHVFDSVTDPQTLLENGRRYLQLNGKMPTLIETRAIDMHMIHQDISAIGIGNRASVIFGDTDLSQSLMCTKIIYHFESPNQNEYTFGNPKQSLTQRYKKNLAAVSDQAAKAGAKGGGGGAKNAYEDAEKDLQALFDAWIDIDDETAHISLGALSKIVTETRHTLETEVGINLDGMSGNVNLSTFREEFNEAKESIATQGAHIDLLQEEHGAAINMNAAAVKKLGEDVEQHYATITARANDLESNITLNASHIAGLTETEADHYAAITLRADSMESNIELKADKVTINAKITEIENLLAKKINAEDITSEYIEGKIAELKALVITGGLTVGGPASFSDTVSANKISATGTLALNGSTVGTTKLNIVTDFTQALKADRTFLTVGSIGNAVARSPLPGETIHLN